MNGTFTSPNYPGNYSIRLDCVWTINAPINQSIKLSFDDFETESCHDYVQLFDGKTVNGTQLDKFCGKMSYSKLTDIISTSNSMTVRFYTDSTINYRGFSANYMVVNTTKGAVIFYQLIIFAFKKVIFTIFSLAVH
jgi:tolloid-like protein 1